MKTSVSSRSTRRRSPKPLPRPPPKPASRRPRIALVGALALAAIVLIALLLSHSAQRPVGANNVVANEVLRETTKEHRRICQRRELLPSDTGAIRVSLSADPFPGPAARLRVTQGGRVLTSGSVPRGWSGKTLTVPVRTVRRTTDDTTVCLIVAGGYPATLLGSHSSLTSSFNNVRKNVDDRPPGDRFRIEYLSGDRESWLSYGWTMARRMGLNGVVTGPWYALLALLLMLAVTALVVVRLARDLRTRPPPATEADVPEPTAGRRFGRIQAAARQIPRAAWLCALVATLNAATWTLISPPFQFIDEQDHVAYVQRVAATGKPPTDHGAYFSTELTATLRDLRFSTMREDPHSVAIWSSLERARLDRLLASHPSRTDGPGAGTATGQPPLYYLLAAVPYKLASGLSLLHQLALIRLLSALLAGATALLVFLFLREALPRTPWAWTVGGLAAALQPLFAFSSASVNPDALLLTVSAALFYCLARGFRRGLTMRLSVATGLVLAAGLVTKFAFAGLVPGAVVALLAIALRQAPRRTVLALRLPAAAIGTALVPFLIVAILNATAWHQPSLGVASTVPGVIKQTSGSTNGSLSNELSSIWQLYLPRVPGMERRFVPTMPTKQIWLDGFTGSFGWWKLRAPRLVNSLALVPALIALLLFAMALARSGGEVRRRALELTAYGLMVLGLMGMIGVAQYTVAMRNGEDWFGQSRYLLPLLAPFAAVIALAARGAGRRWGPTVGVLIVATVLVHDLYSQLLVVTTYYG